MIKGYIAVDGVFSPVCMYNGMGGLPSPYEQSCYGLGGYKLGYNQPWAKSKGGYGIGQGSGRHISFYNGTYACQSELLTTIDNSNLNILNGCYHEWDDYVNVRHPMEDIITEMKLLMAHQ